MPLADAPQGMVMAGFGHSLPERRVDNAEIEADMGLPSGWIAARTGIHSRHYAAPDQAVSDLAVPAGRMALDRAGLAYDTRRCHTAIIDRQAAPIIPIRKNGRPWKEDCPAAIARNETLRATRHYGRAFWKRWTGGNWPQSRSSGWSWQASESSVSRCRRHCRDRPKSKSKSLT